MRWILLLFTLLGMCLFVGCAAEAEAQTLEDLVQEVADSIDEMNGILAEVHDVESAKKAAPRLKQLNDRWQAIEQRLAGADEPDEATIQRVEQVYEKRIADSMIAMMENVMRLSNVPGVMDELEDVLPFTGW